MLVEGVLLFRPPIDAYFDLRLFLHIPFDEVLRRATARDVPHCGDDYLERYKFRYIPVQQWYLETHRPAERSDVVIDNTDYANPHIIRQSSAGCAIMNKQMPYDQRYERGSNDRDIARTNPQNRED
ncbi:MAG: hypothetical protein WHX52_01055 [Anaerolineae bacterium]